MRKDTPSYPSLISLHLILILMAEMTLQSGVSWLRWLLTILWSVLSSWILSHLKANGIKNVKKKGCCGYSQLNDRNDSVAEIRFVYLNDLFKPLKKNSRVSILNSASSGENSDSQWARSFSTFQLYAELLLFLRHRDSLYGFVSLQHKPLTSLNSSDFIVLMYTVSH